MTNVFQTARGPITYLPNRLFHLEFNRKNRALPFPVAWITGASPSLFSAYRPIISLSPDARELTYWRTGNGAALTFTGRGWVSKPW